MRVPRPLAALGFNYRPLQWQDFESLCKREDILLFITPMPRRGFYRVVRGVSCIGLDKRLPYSLLQETAWHEIGHYFLHSPELHLYGHPNKPKTEYQAQVVAACALIPQSIIRTTEFAEIEERLNVQRDLVLFRARVWQNLNF